MLEFWSNLFTSKQFIPHGHCYLWQSELVWLHIISDSLIALAYYSIPITLVYFVRQRHDLPFNWIFLLFSSFIVACGTTHIMEIWTLWHPTYWLSGLLKAVTAIVSVYTSLNLIPLVPQALALPSPAQLEKANQELQYQITQRKIAESALQLANEQLETRVKNRTLELARINEELKTEIAERSRVASELKVSEERFRATFNSIAIGIAHVNTDGRWLLVNQKLCEIVGYTLSELQSLTFQSITYPDDLDADLEYFRQLLAGQIPTYSMEKRYIHKNGSLIWINLTVSLVSESNGEPKYFIGFMEEISWRKQAEKVQQKLQQRLQTLSSKLIEAQEAERRQLARELHDEIGQALTAVKINLQTLPYLSTSSNLPSLLQESIGIVEIALQQVRSLSLDLRPSLLDDLGLIPALRWYVDRQTQRAGIIGEFVAEQIDTKLLPNLQTTCFRVVQEALTNVVRHAKAQRVTIELWQSETLLHLEIRDDGVGFDVDAARERATRGGSLGLLGMEERVLLACGNINIESRQQHGTKIHAWFPMETASLDAVTK
ncbi:sensor histidine kinase [Iningainema tapete]|uniref:histidine kinase n=1 Tax=Iningainema tapete BLCC-T55 TaxID=2748662 RepID=A0A8J6XH88_9CYAN|nr:sensor histidine kinase [Iningainema tapete]MBD2775839.1 PAS domain S-box protein [Iningainema tapete BLCC-T55]